MFSCCASSAVEKRIRFNPAVYPVSAAGEDLALSPLPANCFRRRASRDWVNVHNSSPGAVHTSLLILSPTEETHEKRQQASLTFLHLISYVLIRYSTNSILQLKFSHKQTNPLVHVSHAPAFPPRPRSVPDHEELAAAESFNMEMAELAELEHQHELRSLLIARIAGKQAKRKPVDVDCVLVLKIHFSAHSHNYR